MIQNLKLASRWFPVIEPILKENGIPDDFKYLAIAESGLRNVISPSDAHGYWQFLKGTGLQYGLTINAEVDERYDMEKSTLAATKYLKDAYAKFGNWTLAGASYNAGMGAIEGAVNYQKEDAYYDLYLKEETSRYIFRALAYKIIFENTQKYGFFLTKDDLYNPLQYQTVKVDSTITDLADFAQNAAASTQASLTADSPNFNRSIRFEHISLEQGLSQSVINIIFQDSMGFLWIGTEKRPI